MGQAASPGEMFLNIFRIPELRKKALFTLAVLAVYRLGTNIPVPGIDTLAFAAKFKEQQEGSWVFSFLGVYNALSAGNLLDFTIFSLGIMPYISAEIIFQLLTKVVPKFEEIQKEGQSGQRRIRLYARFATIPICILQAFFMIKLMTSDPQLAHTIVFADQNLFTALAIVTMMGGTFFLMWLGDQITEKGLGNGISLLIMAGIIASIPQAVIGLAQPMFDPKTEPIVALDSFLSLITLLAMFVAITIGIVIITLGRREIVIQHAKHVRGAKTVGGQRQTFPLRIDQAGVIPIIFASALLTLPMILFGLLSQGGAGGFVATLMTDLQNQFNNHSFLYTLSYCALIFFFTYFWTQLQFNPIELAKNFKEWGAFIPGVRPGKDTVTYLSQILRRMTLAGATFLSLVAVVPVMLPSLMTFIFGQSDALSQNQSFFRFMGGTGLLIVVHVALDLVQKVEVQLIQRNYEGYAGNLGARRR